MNASIDRLQEWCDSTNENNSTKKKIAKVYMDRIGLASNMRNKLLAVINADVSLVESEDYPHPWVTAVRNHMKLIQFPVVPMHLCTLGCEKTLISKTGMLVNKRTAGDRELWSRLTASINCTLRAIVKVSVDWCSAMTFSGKDQSMGTANWQSAHYLCFTRLLLFHLPSSMEVMCCPRRTSLANSFRYS